MGSLTHAFTDLKVYTTGKTEAFDDRTTKIAEALIGNPPTRNNESLEAMQQKIDTFMDRGSNVIRKFADAFANLVRLTQNDEERASVLQDHHTHTPVAAPCSVGIAGRRHGRRSRTPRPPDIDG